MSENTYFKEWMEAWNSNDPENLLSFYHDEIFYKTPIISQTIKGKDEFRTYLNVFFSETPTWRWKFIQYFKTKEDRYFVKWKATSKLNGKVVEEEGLDILEFVDQRIIVHEVYFDKSKIMDHDLNL